MIRFALVLLISALLLGGLTFFGQSQHWIDTLPSFFWQSIILLLFATMVIFSYLYRFDKPEFFVPLYLLTMAVKLLAYGAYNFLMIREDKAGSAANVVFFMVLYTVFTGLEIAFLYRKISGSKL